MFKGAKKLEEPHAQLRESPELKFQKRQFHRRNRPRLVNGVYLELEIANYFEPRGSKQQNKDSGGCNFIASTINRKTERVCLSE